MSRYPGGVWWVELAPLSNAAAVGPAALAVLDARQLPGVTAEQQLAAELGERPSLLVLDNCEHVRARCAKLVAGLLAANGSVTVLTTSREPIGVPGEVTWRVPSLTYPALDSILDHMTMSRFAAVELFVDRARRARSTFELRAVDAPAIAQICHRLDGIPLAIELAAARCGQLPVARIATELDERFRFLTGGPSTALPRQQTLAASVDWSHDSLAESERTTFRRLGAFAGPFPLEAAEAVAAAGDGLDRAEIFDLLRRLVDKSLVVADIGATGETRYRLLESIRAYALDRAVAAVEQEAISDAHLAWWSDWLEPRAAMPSDDDLAEDEVPA
jgi:predicted ATPase